MASLKVTKRNTKRYVIFLLTILLLAYALMISLCSGSALLHKCCGEHCIVCLSLNLLKQQAVFLVSFISVFILALTHKTLLCQLRKEYVSFRTPLELKVKLTN